MIKFVGIDLDGTLLDSEKKISEENLKALEKLETSGVHVTIFTGRSFVASEAYFDAISSDIPAVFQNGAFISTIKSYKIIKQITLSNLCAGEIIRLSRTHDLFPILFTNFVSSPDMVYDEDWPSNSNYTSYLEKNAYRMTRVSNMKDYLEKDVSEVAVIGNFDKIKAVEKALNCSQVTMILSTLFTNSNEAFVEFVGPNCGKESALDFLLNKFKIAHEEAAFIGDNYNDLEALKDVGYPIVMGNAYAPSELTKIAKYITSSNNENGVAKAIKEYILKNNNG